MAFDFPSSPTVGQVYSGYVWDGEKWQVQGAATSGAVRYDLAQGLSSNQQVQARSNIGVTKKNYIINGGMQISQEYAGGSVSFMGINAYPVDMFNCTGGTSGGITANGQQVVGVTPGNATHRLRVTVTAANASVPAGDNVQIMHPIEGTRVVDLQSGTANAKTVTLRFGVKAPAGTYCVSILNAAANRFYIAEYVISAGEANTDIVRTITLDLDKTGTWDWNTLRGLDIRWWLRGGSTFFGTPNVWSATAAYITSNQFNLFATNGNIWELFDVGLYEGPVAPPFQMPDYVSEMALCQRYFQMFVSMIHAGYSGTGVGFYSQITFPLMRAAPTLTPTGVVYNNSSTFTVNVGTVNSYRANATITTAGLGYVTYNVLLNARL